VKETIITREIEAPAAIRTTKPVSTLPALLWRGRTHLKLKLALTVLLPIILFVPYTILERWPLLPVTYYQYSWLDRAIPFTPAAAWPYLTCFPFVTLAGCMLTTKKELFRFCRTFIGIALIAEVVFLFHPTAVPARPGVALQPYALVIAGDGTGNACPSLHVAFTVLAAVVIHRALSLFHGRHILRFAVWVWAFVISLSTIAVRQHLAIDVGWGAVLGGVGGLAWINRTSVKRAIRALGNNSVRFGQHHTKYEPGSSS
jgi:hypothetical protein